MTKVSLLGCTEAYYGELRHQIVRLVSMIQFFTDCELRRSVECPSIENGIEDKKVTSQNSKKAFKKHIARGKSALGLVSLLALSPSVLFAEDLPEKSTEHTSQEQRLDRVEKKVDQMDQKLDVLVDNTSKTRRAIIDETIGDRSHGVEFNFLRLLLWGEDGQKSLSGGYSYFDTDKGVEIAVPFVYANDRLLGSYFDDRDKDERLVTMTTDIHFRKYLNHRIGGMYISGFARHAYLRGMEDEFNLGANETAERITENKLGLGVGIGYRSFSESGIYWGASLNFGRYVLGDSDIFADSDGISSDITDSEFIFDVELLKFGYVF